MRLRVVGLPMGAFVVLACVLTGTGASARPSGRDVQIAVRESGFESFVGNTNVAGLVHAWVRGFGAAGHGRRGVCSLHQSGINGVR